MATPSSSVDASAACSSLSLPNEQPCAAAVGGFDNEPPAELQEKRQTAGLGPLPRGPKVYSWELSQVWTEAADGTKSEVSKQSLTSSRVRLARFGVPCDSPESAAVVQFQRTSGGYTVADPLVPLAESWDAACDSHVTYAVASGSCRFEFSNAVRGAGPGERTMVRAVAGDGVTALKGVTLRLVPETNGTAGLPLFNEGSSQLFLTREPDE